MKIHNITEGYSYISDSNPQPEQKVVDKFARVADSQRSYYIMKWAEEKGMDTDDAMHKAGYVKDGYLGAGAYNWRYVGMGESVEEANNPDAGEYTYTLELNGESQGYTTHTLTITSPEGESKVVADDFTYFEVEGDELQAELHSWFNMGHGVGDESVQEADDEVDTGPTWKDDLEDALDGYPEWAHEYIKDGVCPECGGNGYMDGDYENEDGEENDECNGMYNYDCDEGEIRDNTWADELKSKEPEAPKQPAPSKEQIMKILPRLHDDYVKSGRYNAFELGGILKQMYPELNKREAGSYVADFFKTFEEDIDEVAGAKDCWPGYKKDGTQAGTGKNKGKRVNKCVKEDEVDDEVDTGPTWKDDLEDALDGYPEWAHEYIKDGVCPECGGNGYMDGDYENEDGEENDECNGMYNYDCDEGEIRDNTWADELKSKEPEAPKQPAPSKEQIMKLLPMLHKEYVQSGRYNAFELGGILKQMYPELNKREAGSYVADFLSTFKEDISEPTDSEDKFENAMAAYDAHGEEGLAKALGMSIDEFDQELNQYGMEHGLHADDDRDTIIHGMVEQMIDDAEQMSDMRKLSGLEEAEGDDCEKCNGTGKLDRHSEDPHKCNACDGKGKEKWKPEPTDFSKFNIGEAEESSDEVMVAKMLAKALGDPNRWTEMSAPELYAELESTNPDVADMIRNLAKMLYDVKLEERAYKDVGVADTVKDQRGKEFNFDKGSKKFKSQDGEEADVTTKLGKDLMRIRKNQMKKTTPSYKTKKNQGLMASYESIEEAYGDSHEITLEDNEDFNDVFGVLGYSLCEQDTFEAEYQGRKVKLNKPMQGDVKKFKVYVKDPKTKNVKKVNFGHGGSSVKGKAMKIRKNNPKARKSFRARHNCDNPGPKTKARYWSCRKW